MWGAMYDGKGGKSMRGNEQNKRPKNTSLLKLKDDICIKIKRYLMRYIALMPYPIKRVIFIVWCKTTKAGRLAGKGERFIISSWEEAIESGEFYHLYFTHHYWWALQNIEEGSQALDLGCGSGYGSWYLAHSGNYVLGIDIDKETIDWAKKHFIDKKLSFELRSPSDFYYGSSLYDYVVCFEVLEHVSEQHSFLQGIYKSLKPDGILIISTANAGKNSVRTWLLHQRQAVRNPGHVKELDVVTFRNLLKHQFQQVTLYGHCLRRVNDFDGWQQWRFKNDVKFEDFEMRKDFTNCEVIVAVCRR